ncbi:MAG: hypothetical protein JJT77_05110 [Crocinitomicaceae bacterium]|nr:hypothetical protein [Crocinitomicaceae bacterium]
MKNSLIYYLTFVMPIFIGCQNENKQATHLTEDDGSLDNKMETKILLELISHFDYVGDLEIGWSRDEVQSAIPDNYKLFVNDENYLSFQYQEDLFEVVVSFGFFEEKQNSNYSLSIELDKEKELLLTELSEHIEEKISLYWLKYLYTSTTDNNYSNWLIKRDAENIVIHLSTYENHLNVNASSSETGFLDQEEDDGEWVQVGEDGRWVFVPKN